jgi:hypothetical protein
MAEPVGNPAMVSILVGAFFLASKLTASPTTLLANTKKIRERVRNHR